MGSNINSINTEDHVPSAGGYDLANLNADLAQLQQFGGGEEEEGVDVSNDQPASWKLPGTVGG